MLPPSLPGLQPLETVHDLGGAKVTDGQELL